MVEAALLSPEGWSSKHMFPNLDKQYPSVKKRWEKRDHQQYFLALEYPSMLHAVQALPAVEDDGSPTSDSYQFRISSIACTSGDVKSKVGKIEPCSHKGFTLSIRHNCYFQVHFNKNNIR